MNGKWKIVDNNVWVAMAMVKALPGLDAATMFASWSPVTFLGCDLTSVIGFHYHRFGAFSSTLSSLPPTTFYWRNLWQKLKIRSSIALIEQESDGNRSIHQSIDHQFQFHQYLNLSVIQLIRRLSFHQFAHLLVVLWMDRSYTPQPHLIMFHNTDDDSIISFDLPTFSVSSS